MTIKGIHIKWNHPIMIMMFATVTAALAVVIRNPESMRFTFHSAVEQPEWMRLHNFHEFVYSPKNDNWGGRAEKWLQASSGDWYFVTPENELFAWDGSGAATGELVASGLDASFYQSPPTTISSSMDVAGAAVNLQQAAEEAEQEPAVASDYPLCDYCTHYEVSGASGDEVYDNMRAGAPSVDGEPMAGVTRFSWSYQAADCTRLEQAQISTGIETSMPHWVNFAQGSEALQAEWLSFYNALLVHEDGHREELVELTAVNEEKVRTATECEQANEEVTANHASFRDRNLTYDAETDHGRTQGADAGRLRGK